ncbi:uncharacterized protein LOC136075418 isoform X2 [Hydra vulgaris]
MNIKEARTVTRKRSQPNTSPIKRLYSVVTIIEDEKQKKMTVPVHWVDELKSVVYWPPKDKKQINYYISNWVSPDKGWGEYILLKINLDKGTKEMCYVCMKFDSESSNSDFQETVLECNSETYCNRLWVRESSPDITVEKVAELPLFSSISFCKSPSKHPKIVSTQKYQEENVLNSKSYQINKSQSSLSSVCQNDLFLEPVQKTIPRGIGGTFFYDEPPASFKAMGERRFQYAIFMELASLKSEIKKSLCSIEKLGRRTEPEETLLYICKSNDIREFDERETFLNDKEKLYLLVRQLKQIGGSSISASVNKVLDETMSKSVQSLFNKAGRHGKRSFRKTLLYKAIIETLVSHSTKSVLVDKLIGDHLKRAPDRIE